MKYKLKKWYPALPIDWEICMVVGKGDGHAMFTPTSSKYSYYTVSKEALQYCEYWSPFLFTTEDKVDIFDGDEITFVNIQTNKLKDTIPSFKGMWTTLNEKVFSSREAAQKWIDEQNKPKFEVGEWLIYDNSNYPSKALFRYKSIVGDSYLTTEGYHVFDSGSIHITSGCVVRYTSVSDKVRKASASEIESILTKVAAYKGFKAGVKFKSAYSGNQYVVSEPKFRYYEAADGLYNVSAIYWQGKWAEIVKEEVVPEYVECLIGLFKGFTKGKIYKVNKIVGCDYFIFDDSGRTTSEWGIENFKPSTKEAYDLQQAKLNRGIKLEDYIVKYATFFTEKNDVKSLQVSVDGEITNIDFNKNSATINFK